MAERQALYNQNRPGARIESGGNRDRIMKTTDKLDKGTDSLAQAHRMVLETEEIGQGVMTNMYTQREQLLSSQAKVLISCCSLASW